MGILNVIEKENVLFLQQQQKPWCGLNTILATNTKHSIYKGFYKGVNSTPARANRPLQAREYNLVTPGFLISLKLKLTPLLRCMLNGFVLLEELLQHT